MGLDGQMRGPIVGLTFRFQEGRGECDKAVDVYQAASRNEHLPQRDKQIVETIMKIFR